MSRNRRAACWLVVALGVCVLSGCKQHQNEGKNNPGSAAPTAVVAFPVEIRDPPIPQGIATSERDAHGKSVSLQCQACHSVRPANAATCLSSDLNEFHQGLKMAHGNLTCVSCHQAEDGYRSLKLADGRSLPFAESMTLCSQCHGTQFRDYQHGAHGGMTGYWDLSKGGRTRNHCVHCHDPHAPKYPTFTPVAAPHDRFPPAVPGDSHE